MDKIKGRIETANEQHYWYDKYDEPHKVTGMSDEYISKCLSLLVRRKEKKWLREDYDQTKEIEIFNTELDRRDKVKSTTLGKLLYA